jgi:hypothetical protein
MSVAIQRLLFPKKPFSYPNIPVNKIQRVGAAKPEEDDDPLGFLLKRHYFIKFVVRNG